MIWEVERQITVGSQNTSHSYDSSYVSELHLNQRSHKTFVYVKGGCEFSIQDSPLFRLTEACVHLDEKYIKSMGHNPQRFLISPS